MKTFVMAVCFLCSYQLFAQDVPLLQMAQPETQKEMDLEQQLVAESLEKINTSLALALTESPTKAVIAHTYARSIVTTGSVQIGIFTTDEYEGVTTQSKLDATLEKLNTQDNMNWKPAFLKYTKQLAEASEKLAECAPENTQSCLAVWGHIQNRLGHIVEKVEDGTYLHDRGPGLYASLEDVWVRLTY